MNTGAARVGRRDLRRGLRPAVRVGRWRCCERLPLRGDETRARRRLRLGPGHRSSWSSGCPRGRVIAVDGSEAMIAKARERLGERRDLSSSPTCSELELDGAGRPRLLDRDLPLDPRPRPALRAACARPACRAAGWSPSAAARATSPSTPRRSPRSPPRPEFAPHFEGMRASSGTSPRRSRPRRGCGAAGFAEVALLAGAEAGARRRAARVHHDGHPRPAPRAAAGASCGDPFAEARPRALRAAAGARLRPPQHRGRRRLTRPRAEPLESRRVSAPRA